MRLIFGLSVTLVIVTAVYLYLGAAITPTEETRLGLLGPETELPPVDTSDLRRNDRIEKPDRPEMGEPLELPPIVSTTDDFSDGPYFDLAVPLTIQEPVYPPDALEEGIEGWVLLEFDILPNGKVENPRVIDSSPEGLFDDAALEAIKGNTYKPKVVGETPVRQDAMQDTIEFFLDVPDPQDP